MEALAKFAELISPEKCNGASKKIRQGQKLISNTALRTTSTAIQIGF
jgi:hypothetical protein